MSSGLVWSACCRRMWGVEVTRVDDVPKWFNGLGKRAEDCAMVLFVS